jgi:hypothetical protein
VPKYRYACGECGYIADVEGSDAKATKGQEKAQDHYSKQHPSGRTCPECEEVLDVFKLGNSTPMIVINTRNPMHKATQRRIAQHKIREDSKRYRKI